jgi:hypothetical protein
MSSTAPSTFSQSIDARKCFYHSHEILPFFNIAKLVRLKTYSSSCEIVLLFYLQRYKNTTQSSPSVLNYFEVVIIATWEQKEAFLLQLQKIVCYLNLVGQILACRCCLQPLKKDRYPIIYFYRRFSPTPDILFQNGVVHRFI